MAGESLTRHSSRITRHEKNPDRWMDGFEITAILRYHYSKITLSPSKNNALFFFASRLSSLSSKEIR